MALNSILLLADALRLFAVGDGFASLDTLTPGVLEPISDFARTLLVPGTSVKAATDFAFLVGAALGANWSGLWRDCGGHVSVNKNTQSEVRIPDTIELCAYQSGLRVGVRVRVGLCM